MNDASQDGMLRSAAQGIAREIADRTACIEDMQEILSDVDERLAKRVWKA